MVCLYVPFLFPGYLHDPSSLGSDVEEETKSESETGRILNQFSFRHGLTVQFIHTGEGGGVVLTVPLSGRPWSRPQGRRQDGRVVRMNGDGVG